MGQKIHPISLRIQSSIRLFDQAWYSDYFYADLITLDLSISRYINSVLKMLKLPSARFAISYFPKTTRIFTFFCYPKNSRDYKSKVFHIPSGLPTIKSKKHFTSKKNSLHIGLWNTQLFQKIAKKSLNTSYPMFNILHYIPYNKNQGSFDYFKYIDTILTNSTKIQSHLLTANSKTMEFPCSKSKILNFIHLGIRGTLKESTTQLYTFLTNFIGMRDAIMKSNQTPQIITHFQKLLVFSYMSTRLYTLEKGVPESLMSYFSTKDTPNFLKYNNLFENTLSKFVESECTLIPFKTHNEWQDAGYFAEEIVFLLERRISFRRIKNRVLNQLQKNPWIRGVRITCSGRVGGKSKKAQRAKVESIKFGQTSLHVFSSYIDFAVKTAYTSLGSTGVKVWICYK